MKIYLDENLPSQIAVALNILQDYHNKVNKTSIEVLSIPEVFGKGALDEDWIPKVKGSFVITKDVNIQRKNHQRKLYEENKLGMFYISAANLTYWDLTKLLIKEWEKILKIIRKDKPPFAYKANSINNGFKLLD